jgi:type I restriction enzyme S subunit
MQLAKQRAATKQTEIGVIPADWNVKPLGDLGEALIGLTYRPEEVGSDGTLVLRSSNIQDGRLTFNDNVYVRTEVPERIMVSPGDILVCVRNGSRDLIGKTAMIDHRAQGMTFGAFMAVFRSSYSRLLFHTFNSGLFLRQVREQLGATINQITNKSLTAFVIPLPPTLAEQEAIAAALSDADGLIESLEKLIAKKRQIKHGTMQELLTGKRRLPGFIGKWETKQVREVIFKHFCGPSPTCEERNIENAEEWGVLKTTAITWENGWDWTKHKVLPRVFWNNPDIELRVGDVVVTKAGPRHRVGVSAWVDEVPKQIVVSGKMIGLRPDPSKANAMMLAAAIGSKAAQRYLDQRTTGMAESQVNFENTVLLETPIQIPKIEEQSAIATILPDMDAEIAALAAKLTKARQVKQGMMQELLTGRTRLI